MTTFDSQMPSDDETPDNGHNPDDAGKDQTPKKTVMATNKNGLVVPVDSAGVRHVCTLYHRSKQCPEWYKTVEQVMFAHQTLVSVGVNPLPNLRFVAYIKNALVFFGELPLALVFRSNRLQCLPDEFHITENGDRIGREQDNFKAKVYGAVCIMKLKNNMGTIERMWTLDDARTAKKYPASPPSPWALYTNRMLTMKARGLVIKDAFPDVLHGVAQAEYDYDVDFDSPKNKIEAVQVAQGGPDLNEIYS